MKVLQLTAHFRPNIGGVETHLDDFVKALVRRNWSVTVLTYQPLTTNANWQIFEKNDARIIRIPWLPHLFYKLVHQPMLEFIYLLPGLFFVTPIVLLLNNPDVVHAHGLVAGFVGVFWGKLFGKRVVVSTHSIYNFPRKGLYKNFVSWIFNHADYCLGLSKQAVEEIRSLGVSEKKSGNFTYWIDLNKFKVPTSSRILGKTGIQNSKLKIKEQQGWKNDFVVLFVGRLVPEKGVDILLQSAKNWKSDIKLKICGIGPLEKNVLAAVKKQMNIEYLRSINQEQLPMYYSGSDILIVPSTSEEGFGRVILEALACGLPVVAANRGGIVEAVDKTVGRLIDVNADEVKETVEYFYIHKEKLAELAKNCRSFAERKYSEKNVEKIIQFYTE